MVRPFPARAVETQTGAAGGDQQYYLEFSSGSVAEKTIVFARDRMDRTEAIFCAFYMIEVEKIIDSDNHK
jgi:hypothetical protein